MAASDSRHGSVPESVCECRPEIARLKAIIDVAVEEICLLAEEIQGRDPEMADRLWALANERLELPGEGMTDSVFDDARRKAEEVRQWADLNGGELEWLIEDEAVREAVEKALWLAPEVETLIATAERLKRERDSYWQALTSHVGTGRQAK